MSMTSVRSAFAGLFALVLFSATSLSAQGIDLVGDVGWHQSGNRLFINAERVENNDVSGASGFLRLQIWATEDVYDGNDMNGWVLGTFNLGRLDSGNAFVNLARVVRYFRPPPGIYYTTITLEEADSNGDFFILDYENFVDPVNLGGYGAGISNVGDAPDGDLTFSGDISWLAGNGRVEIFADEIHNPREFGRSGVLRIRLWATSEFYDGGILQGYPMATARVGRLTHGLSFVEYFRRTAFRPPPPDDEYFVTMTLEELVRGRWEIADYFTFSDPNLF
jgi:hypothetical protein